MASRILGVDDESLGNMGRSDNNIPAENAEVADAIVLLRGIDHGLTNEMLDFRLVFACWSTAEMKVCQLVVATAGYKGARTMRQRGRFGSIGHARAGADLATDTARTPRATVRF